VDEPRRDWVARVAVPAFMAHREDSAVSRFATIGTGSGLDAIAALDIFELESLAITDLHPVVVQTAASNIRAATVGCTSLTKAVESLVARSGDLLTPLEDHEGKFDLIYGKS
jgi:methylase of polypeptide subunit release factors